MIALGVAQDTTSKVVPTTISTTGLLAKELPEKAKLATIEIVKIVFFIINPLKN